MIKNEKKKTPSEISEEISVLVSKLFPLGRELFDQAIEGISSTRKTGKVSPNIILAQLKAWENYPIEQVYAGIKIYLSKEYFKEGKDETYLLGIIKNQRPGKAERPQGFKSTGSALLDDYYRKQAKGGQA